VEILRARLESIDGLNLLVIGYSGVDQEVLKLLRESKNNIRSLLVINDGSSGAEAAARRIKEQFERVEPTGDEFSVGEFNGWAQSNALDDCFRKLT
jgi:hypothetical protein